MPYEITTDAHYEDLIAWLQTNVGDLQWSRPIVEWKGRGWTVNAKGATYRKGLTPAVSYIIRVDNPKLATLAALRWAS
jgi:hypothetical protein